MIRRRILLIVLLVWALVMIVPNVLHVATPLASLGFDADNESLLFLTSSVLSTKRSSRRPGTRAFVLGTGSVGVAKQ